MAFSPQDTWIHTIPHARPKLPDHPVHFVKYVFWRVITPFHPHVRDFLTYTRLLRHRGRDNYLLGRLAPNQNIEEVVTHLVEKGFGNHFIAWKEQGQVISMRYVENFQYQYHLRIFSDGEVRGHYEYTPECYMVWHMQEVGMEDRREEFLKLLGDRIIPA